MNFCIFILKKHILQEVFLKIKTPTILKLLYYLPNKIEALIWVTITSIITNVLSLVIPLYFMHVYDKIIPNNSTYTLLIITIGAIFIIILDSFFTIGRGILLSWYSAKFSFKEGSKLMKSLFSFTNKEYYSNPTTDYNESFRSIEKLKKVYAGQLFQSLLDIPFIGLFLYGIYYISGKLVYYHILILIIFTTFNLLYHFLFLNVKKDLIEKNNIRFSYLASILKRIHPLKAQGFEEMLLRKLELVQKDYSESYFILRTRESIPSAVGEFISQSMIYGTIVIGGIMVLQGDLSLGIISAATMLSRRTVGPLLSISRLSVTLSDSKIDFEKLELFKKRKDEKKEDEKKEDEELELPENIEGFLEIRDLSLKKVETVFGNLENINLSVDKGSITGIICHDYSAASILVDVILGIEKPDSGKVLLDSLILSEFDEAQSFDELVVIPRKTELFMGTILENITLFKKSLSTQALDAAAFLGLNDIVSKLPKGYETEITSFSEKILPQVLISKISIARALLTRPRVIISNQADSGMNKETKILFMDILKEISANTTIIVISENLEMLDKTDKLYLLDDSKLLELEGV